MENKIKEMIINGKSLHEIRDELDIPFDEILKVKSKLKPKDLLLEVVKSDIDTYIDKSNITPEKLLTKFLNITSRTITCLEEILDTGYVPPEDLQKISDSIAKLYNALFNKGGAINININNEPKSENKIIEDIGI